MPNPSSDRTPASYDQEIHELYHERNARKFSTPPAPVAPHARTYGQFTLVTVVAVLVSAATTVIGLSLMPAAVPPPAVPPPLQATPASEVPNQVAARMQAATVAIFTAHTGKTSGVLDRAYLVREALGQGLVLSSDGWVVTTQAVVRDPKASYVVLTADGKLYPAEAVVLDLVAPLSYLKVTAQQLTTTSFADAADLTFDLPLVASSFTTQAGQPALYPRHLAHRHARLIATRADVPVSSEALPDRYLMDVELPAGSLGAPVFTTQGVVVGLTGDSDGQLRAVVPLDSLGGVIDTLFAKRQIVRPLLGITYAQASWLNALAADSAGVQGALLMASARRSAVLPGSPAAAAGLKEGDRIISFDTERIDARSLSAVLQQYRPGARVELTVDRQGKQLTLQVTLGELASPAPAARK